MPRVSKIAKLPPNLRQWLHRAFVDRAYGDIEAVTDQFNELLREAGLDVVIGKSSVGRESARVKRAQEAIAATTEAARLIAQASPDTADHRSAAAMAVVQSEVFDLLLQVRESADITDPVERLSVMSEAALAMSRLSRSRVNQAKWADELEKRAKVVADEVARIATRGGLTAEQTAQIRAQILGIAKKPGAEPRSPQDPTGDRA